MARTRKDKIINKLESMRKGARQQLDAFADKIKGEDPSNALIWSANIFASAAEYTFAVDSLSYFKGDNGETDDDKLVNIFLEYTQRIVNIKATKIANKSTSIPSNYMNDLILEVHARFLDETKFI